MQKFINKFRRDEDGAVTVDWVVLTAAIVGLGLAIMSTVGSGADSFGSLISSELANGTIKTSY